MNVPFYKAAITKDEIARTVEVMESGWLTTGGVAHAFENDIGDYSQHSHVVALNSCTAALHLALEAVGIKSGDGVLVPTFTFAASAEVIRYFGAVPVFVDCGEGDFNLDPVHAEEQLKVASSKGIEVKAIIPVHYGGVICDMLKIKSLADRFDLKIIEDAAHCFPSYWRETEGDEWRFVGKGTSDATCFSFYANKCITTGEGGALATDTEAIADRARLMSLHGMSKDAWKRFSSGGNPEYLITAPGYKYNMTDVAAATGRVQLAKAEQLMQQRRRCAETYDKLLATCEDLILPVEPDNRISSWHLYVIRLRNSKSADERRGVAAKLGEMGIVTSLHWRPLHMHPYYSETFNFQPEDFPVAARHYEQCISLPIFPDMSEEQIQYVSQSLIQVLSE